MTLFATVCIHLSIYPHVLTHLILTTRYDFIVLVAFRKLRKENISFVTSVRPSVRMEQLGSHWTDFREV